MKKQSSKCKTGGKASSKKTAPAKKMAEGGKPPKTGKPDRGIFSLNPLKKRVKTKYGSVTGQGKRTSLERSEPSVSGKRAARNPSPSTRTSKSTPTPGGRTKYGNTRFLN